MLGERWHFNFMCMRDGVILLQVPRVHNEDHLHRALGAILGQLPTSPQDPFYGRVKALVMNAAHGPHSRCMTFVPATLT